MTHELSDLERVRLKVRLQLARLALRNVSREAINDVGSKPLTEAGRAEREAYLAELGRLCIGEET